MKIRNFILAILLIAVPSIMAAAPTVLSDSLAVTPATDSLIFDQGDISVTEIMDMPVAAEDHSGGFFDDFEPLRILAVIGIFILPPVVLIIALILILRYLESRNVRRATLIDLSLRTGNQLPPEFFARRRADTRLQSGLYWLAWGVGLMIFFFVVGATPVAALMTVPCLIGLSKCLTYFLDQRRRQDAE